MNIHYLNCSDTDCERTACLSRRDYERRHDDLETQLARSEEARKVLMGALESLHAETKVGYERCVKVIFDGLEKGISTIPNSLPHGNLKFHIPRILAAIEKSTAALAADLEREQGEKK